MFDRMRDLAALGKPRLSMLVICSSGVGLWLAPARIAPIPALITMLATALVVGAANALNSYYERDIDALMVRTQDRPLPTKRVEPHIALVGGLAVGVASIAVLAIAANMLTAMLSLLAYVSYVWVYTPLKQYTPWAVVVGAIPGAIPPLLGWTAATNTIDAGGLSLFALLFFWQIPHFLAIAIYRQSDYTAARLKVLPVVRSANETTWWTVASVIALLPVSLLPWAAGVAGPVYAWVAAALSVAFIVISFRGIRTDPRTRWARRVFIGSLGYLTALFAVLIAEVL